MNRFGPQLPVGTTLDHYKVEAPIARGGMGIVYQARDLRLNRKVALKVLLPELATNEEFRRRFVRESQVAASIDHPNIIPIYGAGESDQLLWIAMRLVEGVTLRSVLDKDGKLSIERTLVFVDQVSRALDAAHLRGLVHRDVKPGNVLIVPSTGDLEDHVYLADFGLTKPQSDDSGITKTQQFLGTVDYMAPEQIQAQPIDGRADVYSLACMFFECLTASPPFAKSTEVATIYAQLSEAVPSVLTSRPELPAGLDDVFRRALAKNRDERYPTCGSMVKAIRRALKVEAAGLSGPPRLPESDSSPSDSSRPPASFMEVARRLATKLPSDPPPVLGSPLPQDETPTLEPTEVLRDIVATTPESSTRAAPASPNVAKDRPPPSEAVPQAATDPAHRDLSRAGQSPEGYVSLDGPTVVRSGPAVVPALPTRDEQPEQPLSPQGELAPGSDSTPPPRRRRFRPAALIILLLAATTTAGIVLLRHTQRNAPPGESTGASGGPRLYAISSNGTGTATALGPDRSDLSPDWAPGRQIAFSSVIDNNQDIHVMKSDGSNVRRLTKDPSVDTSPAWSPDGAQIAFVREDSDGNQDIWLMNADGTKPHRLTTDAGRDVSPTWSPDGQEIAFVTSREGGTNIWLMEIDGSSQRALTDSGRDIEPSWGKNGLIAFARGRENHDIFAVTSAGTNSENLTKGRPSDDRAPAWSPSGTRIAFVSEVSGEYEVWIMDDEGAGLAQITYGFERLGRRITWSPDGQTLVFSAEKI